MTDDLTPRCEDCNGPGPLTGLGPDGQVAWLCITCLEAAFARLGEKLRNLRQARMN